MNQKPNNSQAAPPWLKPWWPTVQKALLAATGAALAYLERWWNGEAPAILQNLF